MLSRVILQPLRLRVRRDAHARDAHGAQVHEDGAVVVLREEHVARVDVPVCHGVGLGCVHVVDGAEDLEEQAGDYGFREGAGGG